MAAPVRAAGQRTASVERLLDAAAELLWTGGPAAVSVQRVADAAGTSKALVHYHFAAKDALLAACARHVSDRLTRAEAAALDGATGETVLDSLWRGTMAPAVLAHRRALLALVTDGTDATSAELRAAAERRLEIAERHVVRIEALLGCRLAAPQRALAGAFVAVVDGLTMASAASEGTAERDVFDAFWLAVLSLDR